LEPRFVDHLSYIRTNHHLQPQLSQTKFPSNHSLPDCQNAPSHKLEGWAFAHSVWSQYAFDSILGASTVPRTNHRCQYMLQILPRLSRPQTAFPIDFCLYVREYSQYMHNAKITAALHFQKNKVSNSSLIIIIGFLTVGFVLLYSYYQFLNLTRR